MARAAAARVGAGWAEQRLALPGGGVAWSRDRVVVSVRDDPPPPSYKSDTPRPSPRTNRTRRVPRQVRAQADLAHAAALLRLRAAGEPGAWAEAACALEAAGARAAAVWGDADRAAKAPLARALAAALGACRLRPHAPAPAVLGADVVAAPERSGGGGNGSQGGGGVPALLCLQILLADALVAEPAGGAAPAAPRPDGRAQMRRALLQAAGLVAVPVAAPRGAADVAGAQAMLERALADADVAPAALAARARPAGALAGMDAGALEVASPSPEPEDGAAGASAGGARGVAVDPHPRTKWTRRVLHPVLIGHAASFTPY